MDWPRKSCLYKYSGAYWNSWKSIMMNRMVATSEATSKPPLQGKKNLKWKIG